MKATEDTKFKVNMIALLEDIQDQYLQELEPEFKYGMKKMLHDTVKKTRKFIKECDKIFKKDDQISFGVTADDLRQVIEKKYSDD